MKNTTFFSLGLFLVTSLGISAQTNYATPKAFVSNLRASSYAEKSSVKAVPETIVFSEDFSKFTAGTEAAPDTVDIGGTAENGYVIDAKYLKQPGWYGLGVHQAGGACSIQMYEYQYPGYPDIYTSCGYISTPETELFGDITVTFRAKQTTEGEGILWVGLCDNDAGPVDDVELTLTKEWAEYTFKSNKGTFKDNNIVQFSARSNTELLIDDIVIKRAVTKTEPTTVLNPINVSFEEFIARWTKVPSADKYRLNIYKKVEPENYVSGTLTENFDQINVNADGLKINTANPNYPEGWTINVSAAGNQDVNKAAGFYMSAPQSIVLDAVGDEVVTPVTPAFINDIKFWVRPSSMAEETEPSMIGISIWDSKAQKWIPIANMPNYYMAEEGVLYGFNSDQIGLNVNKVKFEYIQKGSAGITFSIDNVALCYESQLVDAPVVVNHETTDTFYVAKNIDAAHEHFYYVQTINGDLVSDKSYDAWVDGIVGLKPVINTPENVTSTSFDVTWSKFNNARSYSVDLSKITYAKNADKAGVVVLDENFDLIQDGTVDNPGMDWGASYDYAEHGVCDNHWISFQPQWAKGMAGTKGTNAWLGTAGFIASPLVALNNNGGAFDVEFTVYTKFDDEEIAVMIMSDLSKNAEVYKTVKFTGASGSYSGKAHFEKGGLKACYVAVMSMQGHAFFLDKIKVVQDLKKGETSFAPYKSMEVTENKLVATNLPEGCDYGVEVTAKSMKDFVYYVSERSDRMIVATANAGVSAEMADEIAVFGVQGAIVVAGMSEKAQVDVFNMQGQLVKSVMVEDLAEVPVSSGIYIVKVGSKVAKVMVR